MCIILQMFSLVQRWVYFLDLLHISLSTERYVATVTDLKSNNRFAAESNCEDFEFGEG